MQNTDTARFSAGGGGQPYLSSPAKVLNDLDSNVPEGLPTKKKAAFTLSEVLITLGIIGVVAAMTLPTVLNDIQDKQFKTAFKKQYSVIAQVVQKAYLEEGETPAPNKDWRQMPKYFCRMQKELNALKSGTICPDNIDDMYYETGGWESDTDWPSTGEYYWHKENEWFDKQGKPYFRNPGYSALAMLLPDGTLLQYICANQIFIDVNGYKKPNVIGRDIFYIIVNNNRITPTFFYESYGSNGSINGCSGSEYSVQITSRNYKHDCESGSGWGCSMIYLLD